VKFPNIKGNYFQYDGRLYFPVGVNYLPSSSDCRMWSEWNIKEIEEDFSHMKKLGINTVRFFIFWNDFEPKPGEYDEECLRRLSELVEAARKYDFLLIPTFVGDVAGIKWVPSWAVGKSIYSEEMIQRLSGLFKRVIKDFRDAGQIFAWDITNEPSYWEEPKRSEDAVNWVEKLSRSIREADDGHLVTLGLDQHNVAGGPDEFNVTGRTLFEVEDVASHLDFISIHTYPLLLAPGEGALDFRGTYFPAYAIRFCQMGKPVLLEEFGLSSGTVAEEDVAKYYEVTMFTALINGAAGMLCWSWIDESRCDRSPYNRRLPMSRYGIIRVDGTEKPSASILRRFSRFIGRFSSITCEESRSAIVVPSNIYNYEVGKGVFNAFILAKMAGLNPAIIRAYDDFSSYRLLTLPFILCHRIDFFPKVMDYVGSGGVILCSLGPGYIPVKRMTDFLTEVLGVEVSPSFRYLKDREALIFKDDMPPLKKGLTIRYSRIKPLVYSPIIDVHGRVFAVNSSKEPALISNNFGEGVAITSSIPLEYLLSNEPRVYEKGDQTYKIYRYAADLAGIKRLIESSSPYVEIGMLRCDKILHVILVNHLNSEVSVELRLRRRLSLIEAEADGELHEQAAKFSVSLGPLEAKVFREAS